MLGGLAGVLLARFAVWTLPPFLPSDLAQISSIHVGGPVLAFALLLSLAAALAFGLAPALLATPSNMQTNIRERGERTGQRRGRHVRSFLVIGEISLAMVLLVAGGLLIRSFALVTSVNPGFDPQNVTEDEVSLPQFQYSQPQQWAAFADDLLARLHAQPGLQDSAIAAPLPMDRQGQATFEFSIVGNAPLPRGKSTTADYTTASPDYFRVMRIPLLRGRFFSRQDSAFNPKVAIISETLARRYFPNQDPIGRQMRFGFPPNSNVSREIVGVVGDVRDVALSQKPGPIMYVPFAQAPLYGGEVVVRSSLSTSSVAAAIRQEVQFIDKHLPVTDVTSFPNAVGQSISRERSHVPSRFVQRNGSSARCRRNFRRRFLLSVAAQAGNRNSRCARSGAARRFAHDFKARSKACLSWLGHWRRPRVSAHTFDGEPALRRVSHGSADIWGRGSRSAWDFNDCVLPPGSPRPASRSSGGVEMPVMMRTQDPPTAQAKLR